MKKVLVLGPALPHWSEISAIEKSLQFLVPQYELNFVDSLANITDKTNQKEFFASWHDKIETLIPKYDVFFGFSLGGVLLQYCFDLFAQKNKQLIFFSVPSFPDETLTKRLGDVIQLIKDKLIIDALSAKNRYIFYPYDPPTHLAAYNLEKAGLRILKGLQFVLEADSRPLLQKTQIKYLHLVGEKSQLVNRENVIAPSTCQLAIIRDSGMRVLQNNPSSCITLISKFLKENL